ncbi:hypothetical protein EGW03_03755 [bacterium]|nr:hypothetical protein [bacterium]
MKKSIKIILLAGIILGIIIYCVLKNNNNTISDIKTTENDVSLSIKENTLTTSSATLILKNNSNTEIQYGNSYEIEIKHNKKWYKLDGEMYFTLPLFFLEPKKTVELEVNWEDGYKKLKKGTYRIIKEIKIEKENNTFDSFYVAAEFTI